jgi:septal ring factor EnvC (AmiA/AmiB activator)
MNGHVVEGTWPKGSLKTGGGAPDDPMLEKRVATLEERIDRIEVKIDRIDEALRRIEAALKELASDSKELRKQVNELAVKLAAIEGQLRNVPTFLQLLLAVLSTWAAGTAIVFALLKATHP